MGHDPIRLKPVPGENKPSMGGHAPDVRPPLLPLTTPFTLLSMAVLFPPLGLLYSVDPPIRSSKDPSASWSVVPSLRSNGVAGRSLLWSKLSEVGEMF